MNQPLKEIPRIKAWLLLALIGFTTPWWGSSLAQIGGHNSFLTVSSFQALALTVLLSFLAVFFLPDSLIRFTDVLGRRLVSKTGLIVLVLSPVILYGLVLLNQRILHSFMNSADEHSCYFLAECLRKGRLWVEVHPLSEFFNVVHVGNKGGKWFSVYPPGWPLLWSFALRWQLTEWLNPALSVSALALFYLSAKQIYGRAAAGLGFFICAVTPFFLFTSASYFSHSTCLFTLSMFLYAFLKLRGADSEKKRLIWGSVTALAVGYGLMTRYLTMFAVAVPFGLVYFWPLIRRKRRWQPSDTVICVILLVFTAVILYQNFSVTGKPFRAPNKHDKSWERLGFRKNYTPLDGIIFILTRIFYLMDWMAPAFIAVYLMTLFNRKHSSVEEILFRFSPVMIAFAYFFYFSWGGNQYGPRYYYEGMPWMTAVIAHDLLNDWKQGTGKIKKFILMITAVSFLVSGSLFNQQSSCYETISRERKALFTLAENTLDRPAIVFINGFLGDTLVMGEEDVIRNSPFLDGKILYAHDLGARNFELKKYFPARAFYRGFYDRKTKRAILNLLEAPHA